MPRVIDKVIQSPGPTKKVANGNYESEKLGIYDFAVTGVY
jgi:hypothetical protein